MFPFRSTRKASLDCRGKDFEREADGVSTFVLIPGAWHGAWCWQRVTPRLVAAGHAVRTPELLGMGEDTTPLARVSLAVWADQVADVISREAEPVILVGHSRGGVVISEAAERVPDRIATLIYLAGSLLPDGVAILDYVPQPDPDGPQVLDVREDGSAMLLDPFMTMSFFNATDEAWVSLARNRLTREPLGVHATPLRLTAERFGRVKRAYIRTTRDNAVTTPMQERMLADLPCDPVFTLNSDHSSFLADPDTLVAHLLEVADAHDTGSIPV